MKIDIKQTPNYTPGEGKFKPIGYVFHGTLGTFDGAVNWLMTPPHLRPDKTSSSAHKVFAKDGRVVQLVKNTDISWHAGRVNQPNARAQALIPKVNGKMENPNSHYIGWEFEWFPGDSLTEAQCQNAIEQIKADGIIAPEKLLETSLSHKEITVDKADDMFFALKEIQSRLEGAGNEELKAQIITLINKIK